MAVQKKERQLPPERLLLALAKLAGLQASTALRAGFCVYREMSCCWPLLLGGKLYQLQFSPSTR